MRVISVVSGKGGVGKTTLVANIGSILASRYSKNVILVDCNITTPHLGLYMGIDYNPTNLNHVLKGHAKISEAIYLHQSGAKVIPSSLALRELDGVDVAHMKATVNRIKKEYPDTDYILLDCAPGLGREAMAGIRSSEEVIYVTMPYFPIVADVVKCRHVVDELGLKNIGIVLNMKKDNKHELSAAEIENITELPIIGSVSLNHDVLKSLHRRIPVSIHTPSSRASREFTRIAASIAGEKAPRDGLLGVILRLFE